MCIFHFIQETTDKEEDDYDSIYYSKENRSRENIVAARQLNQDVMENPYYGDAMDNNSQNNEKESYEYSPCDVSAVTKIENVYYEA